MTTYFCVRADYGDPSGGMTHEGLFGYERTVFTEQASAWDRRDELAHSAKLVSWGGEPPYYYVEEVSVSDLLPFEEDQLNAR